jgi:hypothetical protein
MRSLDFPGIPRSRTGQAVVATALYCVLTLFALYGPIDPNAPFVKLLGSQALARQFLIAFVQTIFWPLIAILGVAALRGTYEFATRKRAGSE